MATFVGGAAGDTQYAAALQKCVNSGMVAEESSAQYKYVGGVSGGNAQYSIGLTGSMEGCYNSATVYVSQRARALVGGACGPGRDRAL